MWYALICVKKQKKKGEKKMWKWIKEHALAIYMGVLLVAGAGVIAYIVALIIMPQ